MFLDRLCDFSGRRVRGTGVSLSARKVWPTIQLTLRKRKKAKEGGRRLVLLLCCRTQPEWDVIVIDNRIVGRSAKRGVRGLRGAHGEGRIRVSAS